MKTLAPVDFKAVAAKGCFVYCYLRAQGSKSAKEGSPYYVGIGSNASRATVPHTRGSSASKFHDVPVPKNIALIRLMGVYSSRKEALARETALIRHYGRKGLDAGGILLNRSLYGCGGGSIKPESAKRIGISLKAWAGMSRTERDRARDRFDRGVRGEKALLASIENLYEDMGFSAADWDQLDKAAQQRAYARFNRGIRSKNRLIAPCLSEADRLENSRKSLYQLAAKRYGVTVEFWAALSRAQKKSADQRFSRGVRGADLFSNLSLKKIEGYKDAAEHGITRAQWDQLPRSTRTILRRQAAKARILGISINQYMEMTPGQRMVASRNGLKAIAA